MPENSSHIADSQLQSLLFDDEQSAIYQATAAHVETCATCRARLEALSGPEGFDSETRDMLAGFENEEPYEKLLADDAKTSPYSKRFDCLEPPTHPEMLGRLGRYEIETMIGSGGMGVVFKGFDTELNRPVAVKVLAPHLCHSSPARKRFAREAKAAAAVVHEHVVAIHNVEAQDDQSFLVMSYVAGESLQTRVERNGPLDIKEILRIGSQIASGLQAAHDQGVVHRDIKPGNILLEQGIERALVTDFGLAQTVDDASLTQTGIVTGTPHYMSPEQAMGRATDTRTDLFSLGSVLYFMATGHPPFRADKAMGVLNRICHEPHKPVWQDHPEISDELSDVIDQLLEKKPARRFATAGQLQTTLQGLLARVQQPRRPRFYTAAKRFFRRHRGAVRVASSIAAISCGAFALSYLLPANWSELPNTEPQIAPALATQELQEREFSVTTWQQASPSESQQWDEAVSGIYQRLHQLEQTSSPENNSNWEREWDQQVIGLRQQLNHYQNQTTSQ